jgi:hypothetical protein
MTRWKYEYPRLINLDENPATGARDTTCSSGGSDSCGAGSCVNNSNCGLGTYALTCQSGTFACSLNANASCCVGSGVTSDTQHACSCACVTGSEDIGDALSCNNGETACRSCSWGYGTIADAHGCWAGNGN